METIRPGVTGQKIEPLLVRPRDAWRMLGCGNTHGYELLNAGELVSFLDGRARKITVESIHAYIARRLAAMGATAASTKTASQSRKHVRPPKVSDDFRRHLDELTRASRGKVMP